MISTAAVDHLVIQHQWLAPPVDRRQHIYPARHGDGIPLRPAEQEPAWCGCAHVDVDDRRVARDDPGENRGGRTGLERRNGEPEFPPVHPESSGQERAERRRNAEAERVIAAKRQVGRLDELAAASGTRRGEIREGAAVDGLEPEKADDRRGSDRIATAARRGEERHDREQYPVACSHSAMIREEVSLARAEARGFVSEGRSSRHDPGRHGPTHRRARIFSIGFKPPKRLPPEFDPTCTD
jgi:hypothetical protein